ncbi:MAG: penicillin-binding protein 2 [Calditrichia bacterium]
MSVSQVEIKKYGFIIIITLLFVALVYRFYDLQIEEVTLYSQKSLQNSVRMITRTPVRGNIYDRNGRLIVDNRPAFSLYLVRSETTDKTIAAISRLSGQPEDEIKKKLRQAGPFQPVKVIRQVDAETLTWIQENITDLPGVEWKTEPKRHYARPSGLAHLMGSLGEADDSDLKKMDFLEPGDIIGKKALEKSYDNELRGNKGVRFVKVDALGRVVEEISTEKTARPYPGKELYLTIDLRLQSFADSLMEGKRGALVAIDTRTGEILTQLSKPDYNLDYFTGVIPSDLWSDLLNDPFHPLYDRVCQSGYPPGSTYKIVAAIAALNENIINPSWSVNCPGYFQLGRRTIHCWKAEGHGKMDLRAAIENSCNVYFYKLGLLIGIDAWHKYSRLFRFGERTGIELTNENSGLVPSVDYYDRVYGEGRWTQGMLANLAIGQGELLVTPLQIAQFVMILANRGVWHRPHLGQRLIDPVSGGIKTVPVETEKLNEISQYAFKVVLEGMHRVVDGGTGGRAKIPGIPAAGKTGTAQNPHGKSHAWFMGFAPYKNPEIAVCVLVENGGSGGGNAAPIAGEYFKKYFYYQGKYEYPKKAAPKNYASRRDTVSTAPEQVVSIEN